MKRLILAFCALLLIGGGAQAQLSGGMMFPGPGMPAAAGGGGCTQATNFLARVTAASLTIDGTHTTAYTNLICGLVTDGIITGSMSGAGSGSSACGAGSFDGLYIYATNTTGGSNATLAGLNLCGTSFTTAPTGATIAAGFTPDRGWFANNAATDYLETGFNPFTATSPNFTINSSHFAVWNNTNVTDSNAAIGTGNSTSFNHMYVQFSAGNFFSRLNDASASGGYTISNPQGLLIGNRSSSSAVQAYQGSTALSGPSTSTAGSAVNNATMQILRQNGAGASTIDQLGAASFGGSLSSGQVTSYYSRMKTYMTAVGVCGVITCP